jgi:hypothetical protein
MKVDHTEPWKSVTFTWDVVQIYSEVSGNHLGGSALAFFIIPT